jgi:DNA-binding response OmpR family regulator
MVIAPLKRALLLVDEECVRSVVRNSCERIGFEVSEARGCTVTAHSECDLGCCWIEGGPDLVIIEVILHRPCSGMDAAQKILQRWTEAKILLISASPVVLWPEIAIRKMDALPASRVGFLPKPFDLKTFKQAADSLVSS